MGFLKDIGNIVSFEDAKDKQKMLKLLTANQFIYAYDYFQDWNDESVDDSQIRWGYQIEGHRLIYDAKINKFDFNLTPLAQNLSFPLLVQYGKWMFEIMPNQVLKTKSDFRTVIQSFRSQFNELNQSGDIYLTIPTIPFLGQITQQKSKTPEFNNIVTQSKFIEDKLLVDHLRHRTIQSRIRQRKGQNVDIRVPIFKDKNTDLQTASYLQPYPGYIYMDTPSFAGVSCLQCTFQAHNIKQARLLSDNLHILSPLFLAMTAGTAVVKGKLSDWDVRWHMLSQCFDDRTDQEKDSSNLNYQPNSRYCALNHYLSNDQMNRPEYSDVPVAMDNQVVEHIKKVLQQKNIEMDDVLLKHLGIIFSRQHLIVYETFFQMQQSDQILLQLFKSCQYDSVRFKVAMQKSLGWRNEFRTMEVQLTADQNAAWSILVYLMVQMTYYLPDLNLYMPLSKVYENFDRAHSRNAILKQKFYFRTNIRQKGEAIVKQMTLHQIFFGSKQLQFIGLLPVYFEMVRHNPIFSSKNNQQLNTSQAVSKFLKKRLTGQTLTLAQWQRQFITNHKDYKHDSIVRQSIQTDMLKTLIKISRGQMFDKSFIPIFGQ